MGNANLLAERRKLIMLRSEANDNLPATLSKAAYIQNTGTQWIATDYKMSISNDIAVTATFAFTADQIGDGMIFGSNPGALREYKAYLEYNNSVWYGATGTTKGNGTSSIGSIMDVRHVARMTSDRLTVDETGVASLETKLKEIDLLPMYIFAWNTPTGVGAINKGIRLYGLRFIVNGSIEADFVPCVRKSDNKPGLYDTVAQKFYSNSGAGEFIAGPIS